MAAIEGPRQYVIWRILAGGIPGFRIVLCCFTHTTVWQCDFCVSVFSLFLVCPHQYLTPEVDDNAITSPSLIVTELDRRSLSLCLFGAYFFFSCVFVCSLLLVLFGCLLCFCNGILTAAGLCTGPIPVHFGGSQPMASFVCIN